jgi:hypothetical protein
VAQHLLEGEVDNRDDIILELQTENQRLIGENRRLGTELATARAQNSRAIAGIRNQMLPWYKAMKALFGEMDAISGEETATANDGSQQAKWEAVKRQMAPRLAQAIDLLMLQGRMRRTQIASALKMDYSNCSKNVIGILVRQGWVVENGGDLSLKQL